MEKHEFYNLWQRLWADGSPILVFRFFETDHEKMRYATKLRDNWTDFILENDYLNEIL